LSLLKPSSIQRQRVTWSATIVYGCFLPIYFFLGGSRTQTLLSGQISAGNSWIPLIDRNFNYLAFLSWLVIILAPIYTIVRICQAVLGRIDVRAAVSWVILGGFSVAGLVQIWPVNDTRHYWWGLPIGLIFLVSIPTSFSMSGGLASRTPNPYLFATIASLVIAACTGSGYLAISRQPAPADSPASGMLMGADPSGNQTAQPLAADFDALRLSLPTNRAALFFVDDGVLSVFDGRYRSTDEYFVFWGGPPSLAERLVKLPYLVVDNAQLGQLQTIIMDRHYKFLRSTETISIFAPPSQPQGTNE
jgi:hypothetical protein